MTGIRAGGATGVQGSVTQWQPNVPGGQAAHILKGRNSHSAHILKGRNSHSAHWVRIQAFKFCFSVLCTLQCSQWGFEALRNWPSAFFFSVKMWENNYCKFSSKIIIALLYGLVIISIIWHLGLIILHDSYLVSTLYPVPSQWKSNTWKKCNSRLYTISKLNGSPP